MMVNRVWGCVSIVYGMFFFLLFFSCTNNDHKRKEIDFTADWKFHLGEIQNGMDMEMTDTSWRTLHLPHDWSIEGAFSQSNPAGVGGGALPGGIGWYRKTFTLPEAYQDKHIDILFEGIYQNSEVWINNHSLGKRPSGYISFTYDLTPYLHYGSEKNVIAVRVDNSLQPNSRWYSGSGIYREAKLLVTDKIHVPYSGTFVRAINVSEDGSDLLISTTIVNDGEADQDIKTTTLIYSPAGKEILKVDTMQLIEKGETLVVDQQRHINHPELWSLDNPVRYRAVSRIAVSGKIVDEYETMFGIRSAKFDVEQGFFLNSKPVKINGVCLHHDQGCLGSAFNKRAAERQLQIMKGMGVNAIRTSHNPPDPTLLDLCDSMGILVMDEMFDMWKKSKTEYDYSLHWDEWHDQDLKDFIKRDRNHPSIIIWSIGNEIMEQWDSTGTAMAEQLVNAVKELDTTRPITTANNEAGPNNFILKSDAFDLIGYNYHMDRFAFFPKEFPGKKFIATETASGLATRGYYDMPSDSIRRWPIRWDIPFTGGDSAHHVSAYDNVSTPWGSTQEETLREVNRYSFVSGQFIWTGFDYIGEPTPYQWPSRSSYFGIVDLAGFPKDVYYLYKSEWTQDTVLHVFPHWNWNPGQVIDILAYYNHADEVELFLNDKSVGVKRKGENDCHVMWRIPFEPGMLKAVSRKNGAEVLTKEIHTAGAPSIIDISADRTELQANGKDLSFVTIQIFDNDGYLVPNADNIIQFEVSGAGTIAGVDNGNPTSLESFKDNKRKAFNGLALLVVQSKGERGSINIKATSKGLKDANLTLKSK